MFFIVFTDVNNWVVIFDEYLLIANISPMLQFYLRSIFQQLRLTLMRGAPRSSHLALRQGDRDPIPFLLWPIKWGLKVRTNDLCVGATVSYFLLNLLDKILNPETKMATQCQWLPLDLDFRKGSAAFVKILYH